MKSRQKKPDVPRRPRTIAGIWAEWGKWIGAAAVLVTGIGAIWAASWGIGRPPFANLQDTNSRIDSKFEILAGDIKTLNILYLAEKEDLLERRIFELDRDIDKFLPSNVPESMLKERNRLFNEKLRVQKKIDKETGGIQ